MKKSHLLLHQKWSQTSHFLFNCYKNCCEKSFFVIFEYFASSFSPEALERIVNWIYGGIFDLFPQLVRICRKAFCILDIAREVKWKHIGAAWVLYRASFHTSVEGRSSVWFSPVSSLFHDVLLGCVRIYNLYILIGLSYSVQEYQIFLKHQFWFLSASISFFVGVGRLCFSCNYCCLAGAWCALLQWLTTKCSFWRLMWRQIDSVEPNGDFLRFQSYCTGWSKTCAPLGIRSRMTWSLYDQTGLKHN